MITSQEYNKIALEFQKYDIFEIKKFIELFPCKNKSCESYYKPKDYMEIYFHIENDINIFWAKWNKFKIIRNYI